MNQSLSRRVIVLYMLLATAAAALGVLNAARSAPAALTDAPARSAGVDMTAAAMKWVASLDDAQKSKALKPLDDPSRINWHFIPKNDRKGLQLHDMTEPQQALATALLKASLSDTGYEKLTRVMGSENILRHFEKTGPIRDPLRYYVTLFGTPAEKGEWGLSIEGHHFSYNGVIRDGKLVGVTPLFFGANPAVIMDTGGVEGAPPVGTRNLAGEETIAYELLASLSPEQRKKAVVAAKVTGDITEGGKAQTPDLAPPGLPASEMDAAQRDKLKAIIALYIDRTPSEFAAPYHAAVEQAGIDKLHFAWSGGDQPRDNHVYRIQGPTLLITLWNTQTDPVNTPANHVHSLWRTIGGDFGKTAH